MRRFNGLPHTMVLRGVIELAFSWVGGGGEGGSMRPSAVRISKVHPGRKLISILWIVIILRNIFMITRYVHDIDRNELKLFP